MEGWHVMNFFIALDLCRATNFYYYQRWVFGLDLLVIVNRACQVNELVHSLGWIMIIGFRLQIQVRKDFLWMGLETCYNSAHP